MLRKTFLTVAVHPWSWTPNVGWNLIKSTVLLSGHYSMISIHLSSNCAVNLVHSHKPNGVFLSRKCTLINTHSWLLSKKSLPFQSLEHVTSCRWCDKVQNKLSAELIPQVTAAPERRFQMCVSSHNWMAPEDFCVVQLMQEEVRH